jgi:hypothetical protein
MDKLNILKAVTEIGVSIGVGSIVGNAIKLTADPNNKKYKKIAIGFGGFVLSSMVSDMASKYATETIDSYAARVNAVLHPETVTGDAQSEEEPWKIETEDGELLVDIKKFLAWQAEQNNQAIKFEQSNHAADITINPKKD